MARRESGIPDGGQLTYVLITGVITSTLGVVIGMAVNTWLQNRHDSRGGPTPNGTWSYPS